MGSALTRAPSGYRRLFFEDWRLREERVASGSTTRKSKRTSAQAERGSRGCGKREQRNPRFGFYIRIERGGVGKGFTATSSSSRPSSRAWRQAWVCSMSLANSGRPCMRQIAAASTWPPP